MTPGTVIFIIAMVLLALLSLVFVFLNKAQALYYGLTKKIRTRRILKKYAEEKDFLYLSDLCLRVEPGKYIDLDYVIIGDRFIYVIANKFYDGFLSGKDNDDKWVLSDGKDADIVDNPILENELKIDYLSRILNVNPNVLVNIVSVGRTTIIDSVEIHNSSFHLLEEKNLARFIDSFEADEAYPVFAAADLEKLASDLYEYHRASVEDKRMTAAKWNR